MRQIYNSSGQIIANKRYDPYGSVLAQSGVGTSNYGYTGEWTDATGLEYLRARYYAPQQGRFTTRDIWEGDPNAPMSYNAWNYTNGNPVNLVDPTGRSATRPDVKLDSKSVSNYETYYLVKMIERNKGAFYGAINLCGEWCTGKLP